MSAKNETNYLASEDRNESVGMLSIFDKLSDNAIC